MNNDPSPLLLMYAVLFLTMLPVGILGGLFIHWLMLPLVIVVLVTILSFFNKLYDGMTDTKDDKR